MSKRDVSSDINLSPVQLINVALLDYMNNMGVVSFQIGMVKIQKFSSRIDAVCQKEVMDHRKDQWHLPVFVKFSMLQ